MLEKLGKDNIEQQEDLNTVQQGSTTDEDNEVLRLAQPKITPQQAQEVCHGFCDPEKH